MIPKIIHYCWFGGKPLPDSFRAYIESWKHFCPDYELMLWDESTFDVSGNAYTAEAYAAKKWAFVTDYVRLWALCTYGGIYMDTDVEVTKPLDAFLFEHGFSGFEKIDAVPTGIMAAEKGLPVMENLLHAYDSRHFIRPDGSLDLRTNVVEITEYFLTKGLVLNNRKQTIEGFTFYPKDWFCPLDNRTLELRMTEHTHTIHHFAGSWNSDPKKKVYKRIKKLLGPGISKRIIALREFLGLSKH